MGLISGETSTILISKNYIHDLHTRFIDNPKHQRFALLELTLKGKRALTDIQKQRNSWLGEISEKLAGTEIQQTGRFLFQLEQIIKVDLKNKESK
jgi:uncharacterized membrane protein YfbV (UPF0208 family)